MEHFVTFLGHVVFLLLTRPAAHNDNFPYHVRTTQIGIMEAMAANTRWVARSHTLRKTYIELPETALIWDELQILFLSYVY